MNRITLGSFQANERTKQLVMEVLESGRLSYGDKSAEYERKFAALHGCRYGVVSNSGTSSLHVALQALKEMYLWPDNSEVIVPALTFVATVNVVLHNNLRPVFVDVDEIDYTIDAGKLRDAITMNTVAIIPVHLFGHPANMFEVMQVAKEYDLRVVEDACEAMLAGIGGEAVGSFGDVGCFSTYAAHHMVTGVGGMGVTQDEELALHMRSLVNHGIALGSLPQGIRYDPTFLSRKFTFDKIGHSFRITELEAAIGLAQLELVEQAILIRKANAAILSSMLWERELPISLPSVRHWADHTWMVFPIVLNDDIDRNKVMQSLNDQGVETRLMMPLINQPCYANVGPQRKEGDFPVAERINKQGFYVGCHQDLHKEDLAYLAKSIEIGIKEATLLWPTI